MTGVLTIGDVNEVLALCEEVEKSLYKVKGVDYQQLVEKSDNSELMENVLTLMRDMAEPKAVILGIKSMMKNVRLLRLTLAIKPPRQLVVNMGAWVKRNLGEDVVIEWSVDVGIVGGAKVAMEGKYGDYSVKKKLSSWWENEGKSLRLELGI